MHAPAATFTSVRDAITGHSTCWFVYLFPLADCSAFKVGFSCNPLQRIYSFSRRYFERFDLSRSVQLQLDSEIDARALEAALKNQLIQVRADPPLWLPPEAGGHTEWYSAVYFSEAQERLRAELQGHDSARLTSTADHIRDELGRQSQSFEHWAWQQAQQACDPRSSAYDLHGRASALASLRDWLDAYRYFDIPLYKDDPAVLEFLMTSVRSLR